MRFPSVDPVLSCAGFDLHSCDVSNLLNLLVRNQLPPWLQPPPPASAHPGLVGLAPLRRRRAVARELAWMASRGCAFGVGRLSLTATPLRWGRSIFPPAGRAAVPAPSHRARSAGGGVSKDLLFKLPELSCK